MTFFSVAVLATIDASAQTLTVLCSFCGCCSGARIIVAIFSTVILLGSGVVGARAQTTNILYSFAGSVTGPDGAHPYAGLFRDSSGNLYGTTPFGGAYGYGTVFELVNSSGSYTEKILYSFSYGDCNTPEWGLVMDASGNLYGTTSYSATSNGGAVFELAYSPTDGTYTKKVLYSFTAISGNPYGTSSGLIMDSSGNLYGTTSLGGTGAEGTVFELVYFPTANTYTERTLYNFMPLPLVS